MYVSQIVRILGSAVILLGTIGVFSSTASAQRSLTDIPVPDPDEELRSFIVAEGFEVNLFAADPMMAKPIQMNFDEQGRLWIASSETYPQIKPGEESNDKILVLEDKDRDGVADSTTVFADGLLIPTGVVPGDGGCYVANSTDLMHFVDTDGDGKADQSRRVLSGFGTEDTHHLLHSLRWGHDGMLYMNQSIYIHSHIETPYGVKHLNGGGIWRFRPETRQLDVLCRGFVNPWGHHFDKWGQSFATDGAYREGINYVFPGSVFVTAPGESRFVAGLNPGSPKHCGLEIASGSHLPDSWQGNMLTNDFRANRVCRFVVTESGSNYASRQEVELLKTRNVAFRPIDVKMGPDGAIYVADWYNPIIQHGEVDFRDPRRDHTHGRIWRITAKDRPLVEQPDIVGASAEQLVSMLARSESWIRLHAKLQMKNRVADDVTAALESWLNELDSNDPEFERLRLEALWAYQAINQVQPELLADILASEDHRARAAAQRVCVVWRDRLPDAFDWLSKGAVDPHARVRIEAVRGLAEYQSAEAATVAARALDQPIDRFLDFAIWRTMRDLAPAWKSALETDASVFDDNPSHLVFALASIDSADAVRPSLDLIESGKLTEAELRSVLSLIAAHGNPTDLTVVLNRSLAEIEQQPEQGAALLDSMQSICRQRGRKRPDGDLTRLATLLSHENRSVKLAAAKAIGTWSVPGSIETLKAWIDGEEDDSSKRVAIESLAIINAPAARNALRVTATNHPEVGIRQAAIAALADVDLATACRLAVEQLAGQTDTIDLAPMMRSLLGRKEGSARMDEALRDATISVDVARELLRASQTTNNASDSLLETIRRVGRLNDASWELTPEFVEKMVKLVVESSDPVRGETIYRRNNLQCLKCHAIGGSGGDVGPDLVSIGASAPVDYLIESLIAPNAKIKENFHSKTVVTIDGKTFTGIPIAQADGVLSLKLAEGDIATIPEDDVEDIVDGRSLMADGLVDGLTEQELADLVRFLSELGKVGDYALGNRMFVRNWESLTWTQEANRRLNRTSYDTASGNDPAFTWQAEYSRVSGEMPIQHLAPFVAHRGYDPTSFLRFRFTVDEAGSIDLQFNSSAGLELWIDGKPTPIEELVTATFEPGTHLIALAVNQVKREAPIRVELTGGKDSPAQFRLEAN